MDAGWPWMFDLDYLCSLAAQTHLMVCSCLRGGRWPSYLQLFTSECSGRPVQRSYKPAAHALWNPILRTEQAHDPHSFWQAKAGEKPEDGSPTYITPLKMLMESFRQTREVEYSVKKSLISFDIIGLTLLELKTIQIILMHLYFSWVTTIHQ